MTRPSRKVVAYALAIAVPTLVLLALGLQSVRRQQQAIAQLEQANRRLQAERTAASLAARVASAAAVALRDPAWSSGTAGGQVTASAIRDIARRHPVARQLVLVDDREVRHPRLHTPLEGDQPLEGPSCRPSVAEAEAAEFAGRPNVALGAYRSCLARTTAPGPRARLLARIARAERRSGDVARSVEVYATLARQHGDETDRFGRPFGLVAALELHDLEGSRHADLLRQARGDLVAGRWDVSDEQARYFLEELRGRLGSSLPSSAPAPFLDALAVARAVQASLPLQATGGPGDVAGDDVLLEGRRTRVYHAPVAGPDGLRAVLVPDARWVEAEALPAVLRETGVAGPARLLGDLRAVPAVGVTASAEGLAPWRLWLAPVADGAASRLPVVLQGVITLLVSGVLGLGVLLLVRDVRRERSLAQMRSQFVSAASHELRTPLAMILLYAQTLLEDVDADREERRGSYEIIAQESERLRHLLDKVLDFSRIDAGRRSYRFEVRDLDESVEAAVRLIEPQLSRRGFTLERDLAPVPGVRHDTEAITGAVLNLVDNAAKYSGTSRRIELRLSADLDEARIAVRDHGIGIPAEDLPRIGERFFRTALSSSIGGYGLGLFLVGHAMSAHGGRLEVTSAPGAGSTFTLVMPRRGAPQAKEPA
ncbi:hypothetical protein TBR22_A13280 [Luteitalea sp. TBR-22]|uniref:sensor histidine kinase n=1 Tax=Luteitalea sp. TBR-22 TaxID=2802971 RepID=UPI001AFA6236|nr:ATP-binding protein [Luteitalea sp. TBR-22]BCS32119.1 hypothetical protein TBR22_A13280 [Luteitalea sp. TBR-22]